MHIITMMMRSKPVFFTCQHFPDYSLLLSFFLLVAFFGSERRALLNFPFFPFRSGRRGLFSIFLLFCLLFWSNFFIREVRVLVNFSLFSHFPSFFWSSFLPREEQVPPTQPSQRTARTGWNTSQPMESITFQPIQMELITPPQMELQMEKWQCSSTGSSRRCWK